MSFAGPSACTGHLISDNESQDGDEINNEYLAHPVAGNNSQVTKLAETSFDKLLSQSGAVSSVSNNEGFQVGQL